MFKSTPLALLLATAPLLAVATAHAATASVSASVPANNLDASGSPDGTASSVLTVTVDGYAEDICDFHVAPQTPGSMFLPGSTLTPVATTEVPGGDPIASPVADWHSGTLAAGPSGQHSLACNTGTSSGELENGVDSSQGGVTVQFVFTCPGTAASLADEVAPFDWYVTGDGSTTVITGGSSNVLAEGSSNDPGNPTNPLPVVQALIGALGPEIDSIRSYPIRYGQTPPVGLTYTVYVARSVLTGGTQLGNNVDENDPALEEWHLNYSTNSMDGTTVVSPGVVRATYMADQRNLFTLDIPDDATLIGTELYLQVRFSDGSEANAFKVTLQDKSE